jgi:tripartite-type tricarboxylate transporter receptor subunit TctC
MRRLRAALFLAVLLLSAGAAAQTDKLVRIIYPYAAGGTGDIVMRLLLPALEQRLGQRILIETRPGAGGNIGAQQVAQAPPDGQTLLLGATNNFTINQFLFANMAFDPQKAFAPITVVVDVPSVFFANPAVPAKTLQEFIALARQSPGALNYATPALGTTNHINMELLSQTAGIRLNHVPFKGLPPALVATIAGDVQICPAGYGPGRPHLAAGKLRALAVGSVKRLPAAPDIPTLSESGFPGMRASNWFGLAAPAGTNPALLKRWADEIRVALAAPEVDKRLVELGIVPGGNTPEEFARQIAEEAKLWERVIRTANIKAD